MVTYWLYYGVRVLTAVRMESAGASRESIIQTALKYHHAAPCISLAPNENPSEFEAKVRRASIRL